MTHWMSLWWGVLTIERCLLLWASQRLWHNQRTAGRSHKQQPSLGTLCNWFPFTQYLQIIRPTLNQLLLRQTLYFHALCVFLIHVCELFLTRSVLIQKVLSHKSRNYFSNNFLEQCCYGTEKKNIPRMWCNRWKPQSGEADKSFG